MAVFWVVPVDRCPKQFSRYVATDRTAWSVLRSDRPDGFVRRYVATGSFAGQSLRGDLLSIFFRCFMNVFFSSD
ncbi:hypothetical protein IGI04_023195 [Brassica rapa subsp. trilocularis]|uniref:Uncharacterized protein n=1 Tax=Brassica rapa subsp. trilocularis TaxID=1813537 RepID=A0ABQ7M359_BRACM|nr:hypothetical protein IGI04_023195 [Brassica rapa subsp. trilocularis]